VAAEQRKGVQDHTMNAGGVEPPMPQRASGVPT